MITQAQYKKICTYRDLAEMHAKLMKLDLGNDPDSIAIGEAMLILRRVALKIHDEIDQFVTD